MHHSEKGITLLELVIVVIVLALLVVIFGPHYHDYERARKTTCANNLRSLWQCQAIYVAQYSQGGQKLYPMETGDEFWRKLAQTPKPIIDDLRILVCPLTREEPRPGFCSYRGPRTNVNRFEDSDPVGADRTHNHRTGQGGNVILKSGAVEERAANDRIWVDCAERLTDTGR